MDRDPTYDDVRTAAPEELVLMLFRGAIEFAGEARQALANGDAARAELRTARVRAIVRELDDSLNPEAGRISGHLAAIYEYVLRRLEPGAISVEIIDDVISDLGALAETWASLVEGRAGSQELAETH